MGHSLPGSSDHGIFQARVLDLGANCNLFQRPWRVDVLSTYPLPCYSGHVFWWQGVGGSLPALVPLFLCLVPVFLWLSHPGSPSWSPGSDEQEGFYSWVPQDCGSWRDGSCEAATPRTLHRLNWGASSSLAVKKASLLLLEHQLGGQTSGLAHILWLTELLSRNVGCCHHLDTLHLSCFSSLESPRKELHSSGALIFVAVAQGITPAHLTLVASGAHSCSSTGLCIFVYFKNCYLRVWLPASMNLGTEILFFGTLTFLACSQLLGAIKNVIGCLDKHKIWETTKSWGRIEQDFSSIQGSSFQD